MSQEAREADKYYEIGRSEAFQELSDLIKSLEKLNECGNYKFVKTYIKLELEG